MALDVGGQEELANAAFGLFYKALLNKDEISHDIEISPCADFREWCSKNKVEVVCVSPAEDVELTARDGAPVKPYTADKIEYAVLPKATVVAGWDYAITHRGEVLNGSGYADIGGGGEYSFVPHVASRNKRAVIRIGSSAPITIDDDVLFLSSPERFHFGHWVVDFLPRLQAWRRKDGSRRKVFLPKGLPSHQRETLALFGLKNEDLIEGEVGQVYRFKSLAVYFPHNESRIHPEWPNFSIGIWGHPRRLRMMLITARVIFLNAAVRSEGGTLSIRPNLMMCFRNFLSRK